MARKIFKLLQRKYFQLTFFFEARSQYVVQAGLDSVWPRLASQFVIIVPQPFKCWDCGSAPLQPEFSLIFETFIKKKQMEYELKITFIHNRIMTLVAQLRLIFSFEVTKKLFTTQVGLLYRYSELYFISIGSM